MLRTMFDFVVIDCGHNIDMATYASLSLSTHVLLVTALTVPIVRRTKRLLDALREKRVPGSIRALISLVVNRYFRSRRS